MKKKIFIIFLILGLFFSMQTICAMEIDQNICVNDNPTTAQTMPKKKTRPLDAQQLQMTTI